MGKPSLHNGLSSKLAWCLVIALLAPEAGLSLPAGLRFDPTLLPPDACAGLTEMAFPNGAVLCTHGPDPAPAGVDPALPRPLAAGPHPEGLLLQDPPGSSPPETYTAGAAPGIGCFGDGRSGNRVQAVYAVPADRPDRYERVVGSIRRWAAETDAVFQASAARSGGNRRIRFVTDAGCNLVVERVRLSPAGDDTFNNTLAEFQALGLNRSDRKYLVWMESTVLCGIATYYVDDRPGPDNVNNGVSFAPGSVARTDSGCWGLASRGQSIEAHELMHSLGTVQPSSPHASPAGHCRDDADRMCYQDGTILSLLSRCPSDQEGLFDCRHDDYFSAAPAPAGYLATHWNAASNSFLEGGTSLPTLSVADASVEEGDEGSREATFAVSLSPASPKTVNVRVATANGTATSPEDYQALDVTLSFPPGSTARTVTVPVKGDTVAELDETFSVTLSDPVNANLERARAVGTIVDNDPQGQGYWFVAADGGIFSFGDARFHGSTGALRLNQPVVGMAPTPSSQGYWLVARDGGIFSFGDARFFGSTGSIRLNQPIVGMAATPTGGGYWFVAADGGVFSFGDARFFGSTGSIRLNRPIVGMAATPTGGGYWLVAGDGTVFAFGDARHHGSPAPVSAPVVGMAATTGGGGYWLAGRDGAVYAHGDAQPLGSTGRLNRPVVGLASFPAGQGYWLVAEDGGIFAFGEARFLGSTGNIALNQPIVGMAAGPVS